MKTIFFFLVLVCCTAWLGCLHQPAQQPVIPAVWASTGDSAFHLQQGVLRYHAQPFSGYQYELFPNGDTASVTPYFNGRIHGTAKQWHANRQLKEVRVFVNGQKSGEHKGWWPGGQLQFVYHFTDDVYEGSVQEWYANGQLFRNMQYVKGHENGPQQIWQPNGVIFANYEVRNGRNYGLTGTMHCKNQWAKSSK